MLELCICVLLCICLYELQSIDVGVRVCMFVGECVCEGFASSKNPDCVFFPA